jgi:hypothetical protein
MRSELAIGCVCTVIVGLVLALCFGGCYGCSHIQTAETFRDGVVWKLGEKGIIFKTFEGEMMQGGMQFQGGDGDGLTRGQLFQFSVKDPAVMNNLRALKPGQRVRLHYTGYASAWEPKGQTSCFVNKVETIE